MDELTQIKMRMFGMWCGVASMLCLFFGWGLVPGFFPPPISPELTADQIATLFQQDTTRIRVGMILLMIGAGLYGPFAAVVSQYMMKVERRPGMLTMTTVMSGAGNMVLTFYPAIFWLTAAYRPERPAELIYLMNDMGWLQFAGGIMLFVGLPFCIIAAAFLDKSPNPVFPRWVGFLNIWFLLGTFPNQLLFFFHRGPFAWNGLFGLWVPAIVFGVWFTVLCICLRNAILRDLKEVTHAATS